MKTRHNKNITRKAIFYLGVKLFGLSAAVRRLGVGEAPGDGLDAAHQRLHQGPAVAHAVVVRLRAGETELVLLLVLALLLLRI